HTHTYAEYVALEHDSSTKHEFFDGEIYAMAGGSELHSALTINLTTALALAAKGSGCRVHSSDLRIYVEKIGLATFPDASVICGPLAQHEPSPRSTATNPTILIEVTSPSSESYDTGFKLQVYQTIPSLREVILVSHRERCITVHRRDPAGEWTRHVAMAGERASIESLHAELSVNEIYDGLTIS
ncbi:MAG TPA: Uma2 family endonuclease, partial [Kofleriaceae bacterium]